MLLTIVKPGDAYLQAGKSREFVLFFKGRDVGVSAFHPRGTHCFAPSWTKDLDILPFLGDIFVLGRIGVADY